MNAYYHDLVTAAFVKLSNDVHTTFYPFGLGQTLHAVRVSLAFQSITQRSSSQLSWGQWFVGYLMITWGGGILASSLLGIPPPVFYSPQIVFNYIFVHSLATILCKFFPQLLQPAVLDSALWPLDALLRTNGVTGIVDSISNSKIHPEYQKSALTPLIVGAIASAGGGFLVGTFSGTMPHWSFTTPPFLRKGASWDQTLDIWGGSLVAFVYSVLIGHPGFSTVRSYLRLGKPLSRPVAKVYAYTIWTILFAAKAYKTHWFVQQRHGPSGQIEKDRITHATPSLQKYEKQAQVVKG